MLWPFEYYRPSDPGELSRLLAEYPDSKVLAGGSNLIIDMEQGVVRPDVVVDVKAVAGADELKLVADGPSFVGAALPVNRLIDCKDMRWDAVREAGYLMATYQVRNRATVTGNLANASPAADMAPPMLVVGTTVLIRSAKGERRVPLADFFTGVKKTVLGPGEWIFGLELAPQGPGSRSKFYKKQRVRGHDLAIVNLAGLCDPDAKRFRVAVGACAVTPLLFDLDAAYAAASSAADVENALLQAIRDRCRPISDVRAQAEYRSDMLVHFASRLVADIYC